MLTTRITWRPIEEPPEDDQPVTAILAWEDDGHALLEDVIHIWQCGHWISDADGRINTRARWWAPESELVAQIEMMLAHAGAVARSEIE